jgi:hypothetical protein
MDKKLSIGKCVEFYRMNRLRLLNLNLHFERKIIIVFCWLSNSIIWCVCAVYCDLLNALKTLLNHTIGTLVKSNVISNKYLIVNFYKPRGKNMLCWMSSGLCWHGEIVMLGLVFNFLWLINSMSILLMYLNLIVIQFKTRVFGMIFHNINFEKLRFELVLLECSVSSFSLLIVSFIFLGTSVAEDSLEKFTARLDSAKSKCIFHATMTWSILNGWTCLVCKCNHN